MQTRPITMALATLGLCAAACTSEATPEPAKAEPATAAVEPAKPVVAKPVEAAKPVEPVVATPPKLEEPPPPVVAEPAGSGLVSSLPAVSDEEAPAVVFAALFDREGGQWEVDIVDHAGMDVKALATKLEAAGDEAPELKLKAGNPLLPVGFAEADPWTLVTRTGAEHRTAEGFGAIVMAGSGELHFYVRLGKAPKKTKGPALAFRGHLPVETKLVVPAAIGPAKLGAGTLAQLVKALEPGLREGLEEESDEFRERVKAVPIREEHVKLYPGRFPGGRTHVAFVQTDDASEDVPVVISGVFMAKADGSVELFELAGVWGTVELLGLLDVDGDGVDEVFYTDAYHEGWYLEMLQWDGEKPVRRTVTGDGL